MASILRNGLSMCNHCQDRQPTSLSTRPYWNQVIESWDCPSLTEVTWHTAIKLRPKRYLHPASILKVSHTTSKKRMDWSTMKLSPNKCKNSSHRWLFAEPVPIQPITITRSSEKLQTLLAHIWWLILRIQAVSLHPNCSTSHLNFAMLSRQLLTRVWEVQDLVWFWQGRSTLMRSTSQCFHRCKVDHTMCQLQHWQFNWRRLQHQSSSNIHNKSF